MAKSLSLALALLTSLLVVGLWILHYWVASDDFRAWVAAEASSALGVTVQLGQVEVDLWPAPALALVEVEVRTEHKMMIARVEARPVLHELLAGRLVLKTLLVRGADLPQSGIDQLLALLEQRASIPSKPSASDSATDGALPQRLVLDSLTWRSSAGAVTTIDVDTQLRPDGQPQTLNFKVLAGRFQSAEGQVERRANAYQVKVVYGGGVISGSFALDRETAPDSNWLLKGQFDTAGVELASFAGTRITGRLDASTTFSARSPELGALLSGLQSQSRFTVRNALVHGIDLVRAVTTVGLIRNGETRLDTLTGQLNSNGQAVKLNNLVAKSGVLSAKGDIALSPGGAMRGRVNVNLGAAAIGNALGVPLLVSGTLDDPELKLAPGGKIVEATNIVIDDGAKLGSKVSDELKGVFGK